MTMKTAGPAKASNRARLAEGIAIANIPTLLMVLVHLTGNLEWLEAPWRPTRGRGLDDNDSGGLPSDVQAKVRAAALDAICAWRDGRAPALPEPSPELLARMLSVSMGEQVPENYGENIAAGLGFGPDARRPVGLDAPEGFRVLIVGAGVSGICAGIRLKEAGIAFEILEKDKSVGGTWFENQYPGCGVDTPNHLYSFSFAPHDWTHYFALRDELYAYFRGVAELYGLMPHIRLRTKVASCAWDEAAGEWELTTVNAEGNRETRRANVVISGVGVLNIPHIPDIPGVETFPGPVFHTSAWPRDLDLAGKRVAIVGNGATAMQVVPAIAETTAHLTVFARSKQWAAPFPQFRAEVPAPIRYLLSEVPLYQAWYRQRLAWTFNDRIHPSLQKDPDWPHPERSLNAINESHRRQFTDYMKDELGERQDLLNKVLPDYPPFGKRMLLDNGWYRTVARPDVTLVAERLAEVRSGTLIAGDGSLHEADVLVLATGFKASEVLSSMDVVGRGGRRLRDVWNGDDARAYLGTAIPGYPNFFTLLGPNVGLGHGGSIIAPIENQMDYVMSLLSTMLSQHAATVEVRQDVHDAYNERVDAAHERMVWTHAGMENWYRNKRGRVVAITPWRNDDFWRMTRRADPRDYTIAPPATMSDAVA
ncbi:NAD(P)/FAD-dependent oxidoreductase [Aquibium carbonis]|uniref:NAD(P)/FAD-dependent oxidoreductase n=1 Tax=Aquibium carbonis TaxID=2495581 RepID=A0A429Z1Y0_9HYPH|nr:NAD(P)/FAD-dependent oxidoreductase [Aquibium carbonis]RST87712.1 NAD(P)/FAD-dependent oxidoreductase [Aquibium carbonis]